MVSEKQKNILNFINIFIEKNGFAPSVREICEGVSLKSTSTVQYHLEKLIQSGLLQNCLLYTSPSPRDPVSSRMPSSA